VYNSLIKAIGVARGAKRAMAPFNFVAYLVFFALRDGVPNKILLLA